MKFKYIAIFLACFSIAQTYSQNLNLKDYPLKDFVAPDIKYRILELGVDLSSNGKNGVTTDNRNGTNINTRLNYFEYINLKKHQGRTTASFNAYFTSYSRDQDSVKTNQTNFNARLDYLTQNRFYKKNKVFWGVHGGLNYNVTPLNKETYGDKYTSSQKFHSLNFLPYLSVGKGRIEPVESARRALDILIALKKYNRLASTPDTATINELAQIANKIRYKRFFDSRFKTIYQLEELDKAIQALGLIDSADIVYFANLNDIWNYAPNFSRGSGIRFEGGLIPDLWFYKGEREYNENSENPDVSKSNYQKYGIYGFFSFNRMRPMSYAWQSNLMIDFSGGYTESGYKSEHDGVTTDRKYTYLKSLLNASWEFGYYPNTRTYAGITPFVGLSFDHDLDKIENTFGVISGLSFDMYYYVSPRVRLQFITRLTYAENFDNTIPTPFWNNVTYSTSHNSNIIYRNNDFPNPLEINPYASKEINYYVSVRLTYSIF